MLFLLAASMPAVLGQPVTFPCIVPDNRGLGVSYDLTSLAGLQFTARDARQEGSDPWLYTTYLCANGAAPAGCEVTTNDDGSPDANSGQPGPAFQYCQGASCPSGTGAFCKRLGNVNPPSTPMTIDLLFNDPTSQREARLYARGLQINYTGGNTCFSSQLQQFVPRKVTFMLECYDGPALAPPAAFVAEDVSCEYVVFVKSRYGCPSQCMAQAGDRVCNSRGLCGYDATNKKARCFCNEDFFGPYCEQVGISTGPPLTSWAGNIAGGFIGGAIVGALGVLGYNVFTAVRGGGSWKDGLRLERLFAPGATTGTP
jgi:hypothetical protein